MPKFIIKWDVGFGENAEIVEADNYAEAEKEAYQCAKEDFENNSSYSAEPYSLEEAQNYGLEEFEDEE